VTGKIKTILTLDAKQMAVTPDVAARIAASAKQVLEAQQRRDKTSPSAMSNEELASHVCDTFKKLRTLKPYIAELRGRFRDLPKGETIRNCSTWTAFCKRYFDRDIRTIQRVLAIEAAECLNDALEKIGQKYKHDEEEIEPETFTEEEKATIREVDKEWSKRLNEQSSKALPTAPADCLGSWECKIALEVVKAGYRTMSKQNHPDVGGNHEYQARLNVAVAWLRKRIEEERQIAE